jgi:peptidoglycan/LPS O-acetylase OafA/YrhL
VVLFHGGFSTFSGGYVGVDVFFVISGYLITSIIAREIKEGRFSIANFYERRIRRIFPALFFVMAVSTVFAALFLLPDDYRSFTKTLKYAALFISSIHFNRVSGYFDGDAAEKPLLHTWSLSVEEIFYIFFPTFLVFVWRYWKGNWSPLLLALSGLSFVSSVWILYNDPVSMDVFYLAQYRAWELLLGSIIALKVIPPIHRRLWIDMLSVVGVLMIFIAVFRYSSDTVFPGFAALLPCLGSALVIYAGQQQTSYAGRLLARKPFVFLGLISYSLYLWHWPVLVFSAIWLMRDPSHWEAIALIALSTLFAVLSWRYIERPFRGKNGILTRRTLFVSAFCVIALSALVDLHAKKSDGWISRYSDKVKRILAASDDYDNRRSNCLSTKRKAVGCLYGDQNTAPSIVLWGDSHGAVYSDLLGKLAEERAQSVQVFTMPSCPPTTDWQIREQSWRDECSRFQGLAMQTILESSSIHTVVLSARYLGYLTSSDPTGFTKAFQNSLDELQQAGKKVALVYPVPEMGSHVPKTLARAVLDGKDLNGFTQPIDTFFKDFENVFQWLDKVSNERGLISIYPHTLLCENGRCHFHREGSIFYYDNHHISLTGAKYLSPLFEPLFQTLAQSVSKG